jgi:hypothetical protein
MAIHRNVRAIVWAAATLVVADCGYAAPHVFGGAMPDHCVGGAADALFEDEGDAAPAKVTPCAGVYAELQVETTRSA